MSNSSFTKVENLASNFSKLSSSAVNATTLTANTQVVATETVTSLTATAATLTAATIGTATVTAWASQALGAMSTYQAAGAAAAATNGWYVRLGSLLIKGGQIASTAGTAQVFAFYGTSVPFTAVYQVIVTPTTAVDYPTVATAFGNTSFTITRNAGLSDFNATYLAIGLP